MAICGCGMRNDCKLWCEGALKRSLQKFSVYANVSSGLLGKVCMKYVHKTFSPSGKFAYNFMRNGNRCGVVKSGVWMKRRLLPRTLS